MDKGVDKIMRLPEKLTSVYEAERGFTLIELILVITIMGVVFAISMPELKTWSQNASFKGDARALLAAFQHARMEAVKRNAYCAVTFDQPVDGVTYDYVVFVDDNNDRVFDAGEDILYRGEYEIAFKNPDKATPVSFVANGAGLRATIFNSRGLPLNTVGGGGGFFGSVYLKGPTGIKRRIAVSSSGRIRLTIE